MATQPTVIYNAALNTGSGSSGPRINIDYRTQLIRQRESAAPFISLMLNINSEGTKTHIFKTFQTRPNPKKGTLTLAVAQGSTAGATVSLVMTAGQGSRFNIGDIVRGQYSSGNGGTGITLEGLVTGITTDTLTVQPNDPTLTIAAFNAGDTIQIWGNSYMQGSLSANPSATIPELKTFYTGIFKQDYRVDKTLENDRLYGAPERDRVRGEKEIETLIEMEKQAIYGTGVLDTTGTSPRTTMTGLLNQIQTNVLSYGSTLTGDSLFDFMTAVHAPKYATDGKMSRRMVLASADVLSQINKIALSNQRTLDMTTVYGCDVSKLVWAGRTWDFIEDPILSDFLPGWAIVFHPRYVKLREFRPTRLEANIQPNNADYIEDQFLTEIGVETQLEELHGVMHP